MKKLTIKKTIFIICSFGCLLLTACATDEVKHAATKGLTATQIFAQGEKSLSKNNYKDAIKFFEALDAQYPFDKLVEQGQLDSIYAYYKDADYESAIAAADRYIHLRPNSEHTDYAYYLKGVINFDRGKNWLQRIYSRHTEQLDLTYCQQAFVNLRELIRLFPNSIYVRDARQRMVYIRDLMAKRELGIAEFYFEHKAYVAAANRASEVVKHYQGSPQVMPALKILVKSYRELGDETQANQAQRVLELNFPTKK